MTWLRGGLVTGLLRGKHYGALAVSHPTKRFLARELFDWTGFSGQHRLIEA
jgi:hypothetical protein